MGIQETRQGPCSPEPTVGVTGENNHYSNICILYVRKEREVSEGVGRGCEPGQKH